METQGFPSSKETMHSTIIRKSDVNHSSALATLEANCEWCYCEHTLKTHSAIPEETVVSTHGALPHVANVMTEVLADISRTPV
jgi:hypothetical protein